VLSESTVEELAVRKPVVLVLGVIVALAGLLFSLQGFGVMKGSAMSGSAFWAVAGPVLVIGGLLLVGVGARGRLR